MFRPVFRPPTTGHPSRGSALVIVLAFIVLIAIVLLSFLASTQSSLKKSQSSAAMVLTEFLAEAATAATIDDIRQEMLAGSDGSDEPATDESMIVTQPWAMVPGRVLSDGISATDTNFFNLTKQSVRGKAFYPGSSPATFTAKGSAAGTAGKIRASAVNTSQSALNGRLLSPARWNKPMLLDGAGFTGTNQLPDWILISRRGPLTDGASLGDYTNKISSNEDYVIGRFAYNIYDVGGLLDINVAGFDPNDTAAQTNAATKGSMAWADLRAVPGVLDPQKIVQWRNKLSATNGAAYLSMVQNWGEPNGFLKSFRQGGDIENRFFTRQDLLKYAQTYGTNTLTTNALPFLTTFSADTDRPSFTPDPARPKVQRASAAGGNDAYGNDDAINPSLLSVKNADGEPAIKRRFPLERIKYITPNPGVESADKIQKYFGLVWNAAESCWDYQEPDHIKKLSAMSKREPNFIEILQATVDAGSLGGQFQLDDEEKNSSPRVLGRRDGSVSNHIIQIAANIIDQYDSDSYPTAINFGGRTFYGIEDLPYLFGIRITAYQQEPVAVSDLNGVNPLPSGAMPVRCVVMLQPTLWNPHVQSAATSNGPTQFRITANGDVYPEARVGWWSGTGSRYYVTDSSISGAYPYPSNNAKDQTPTAQFDPAQNYITFNTTTSGPAAFREAYTITSPSYPPGSNATGATIEPINDSVFNQASGEDSSQALGFRAGYMWAGPLDPKTETKPETNYFNVGNTIGFVDFFLQYKDASGDWKTYDTMESVPPYDNIGQNNLTGLGRRPRAWVRIDPRTDRFGYRSYLFNVDTQWPQGQSFRPSTQDGLSAHGDAPAPDSGPVGGGNIAAVNWVVAARPGVWGLVSENKPGQTVCYADPDGIQRLAMGGFSSALNGLPMATNNAASRPVVLNRPFRSVAELGYAFRGMPWKQIDFSTPESGDAALLDVFCLNEPADASADPVISGRVNLNTKRPEVLSALLRGVTITAEDTANRISSTEADNVAANLVAWTTNQSAGRGPLRNRGEVIGKFVSGTNYTGVSTNAATSLASTNQPISFRRQSMMRALADGGTTRTWTFLIDLIVQKGRYPQYASGLDKFSVEGEQRYWVHLAIDRFTGEVVSKLVEAVNE